MAACGYMGKNKSKGIGKWLKTKLNALLHHNKSNKDDNDDFQPQSRPLTSGAAHNAQAHHRKKLYVPPSTVTGAQQRLDDDCSQARASSDQTLGGAEATTTVDR